MKRKTHDEFKNEISKKLPTIELLSEYNGSHEYVKIRCTLCGNVEHKMAHHLSRGYGCTKCGCNKAHESTTISHEKFVERIMKIHPNIKVIGTYKNTKTKISVSCMLDGYEWSTTPSNLYRSGCPRCSGKERKTTDSFIHEMSIVNASITINGSYKSEHDKIECVCNVCGLEFLKRPNDLLKGSGCPVCNKRFRYDTDSFKEKMYSVDDSIDITGEYISSKVKISCNCKRCGFVWNATPAHLLSGSGCPHCRCFHSRGEKSISSYFDSIGIEYVEQKRFDGCKYKYTLPFDFYLPKHNIAIEYDGQQHYKPILFDGDINDANIRYEEQVLKDDIKTRYCISNGIKLIRIPYYELENIDTILNKQIT